MTGTAPILPDLAENAPLVCGPDLTGEFFDGVCPEGPGAFHTVALVNTGDGWVAKRRCQDCGKEPTEADDE